MLQEGRTPLLGIKSSLFASKHFENTWEWVEPFPFGSKCIENTKGGTKHSLFASKPVENQCGRVQTH